MACANVPDQTEEKEWRVQSYLEQHLRIWPQYGNRILAQHDEDSIVVYQAFCNEIADYAVRYQKFGGDHFSFTRMSWIKPNFMWMMYRSRWATKPNQDRVLAVRITRAGFDHILSLAFTRDSKKAAATKQPTLVRLQWDPDHDPSGDKLRRRAIQLGLRKQVLRRYSEEWIVKIEDITEFVHQQYKLVKKRRIEGLIVAQERVYPVSDPKTAAQIELAQ
ncbi:hypothetical protein GBAR_LOCUS6317 [Geodia barretti]|uniref:DUF4291 domain-containing protein n=1 Tax=Geodia barretti TaxID=519541 RepID=A0AA35RDC7_GEOBA|nr:hypothetical protein GBAR_LOCUS6317 [Geodia barretti]